MWLVEVARASLVDESSAAKVGNTLLGGSVTIFHVKNPYYLFVRSIYTITGMLILLDTI